MEGNENDHNIDGSKSSKKDDNKYSPTINDVNYLTNNNENDRLKVRSRQEETRAWRQVLQKSTSESDDELVFLDNNSKNNNHHHNSSSSFDYDDQNQLNFVAASAGPFRTPRGRSRSQGTPPLHSPRNNNTSSSPNRKSPSSSQSPPSFKNYGISSQSKSNRLTNKRIDQSRLSYRHNQTSTYQEQNFHSSSATTFSSTKDSIHNKNSNSQDMFNNNRNSKGDNNFFPFSNNTNYYSQANEPLVEAQSSQSPRDDIQSSFFPRSFHSQSGSGTKSHSLSPRMKKNKISSERHYNEENNWNKKMTKTQQQKTNHFNRSRRSGSHYSDKVESSFSPFSQQLQRQNSSMDFNAQSNQIKDGIVLNRSRSRSYHSDEGKLSDPFFQQQYQQRKIEAVDTDYVTSNQIRRKDGIVLNRSRSRSYHSDEGKLSDPFFQQHGCQNQEDITFLEQNKHSKNSLTLNRSRSRSYHSDEGALSYPFYDQHDQHQKVNCDDGLMATLPTRPYKNISATHHSLPSNHNGLILLNSISFHSDEDVTIFQNCLPGNTSLSYKTKSSVDNNGSNSDHEHGIIRNNSSMMRSMAVDDNVDDDVEVMNGSSTLLPMPQPSEQTAKEQMIERERQSRKERERARLKRQIALNYNTNDDNDNNDDDNMTENCLEHESIACTIGAEDSIMVQQGHDHNHECNEVDSEIKNSGILVADNPDDQIPLGFAMERFLSAGVVVESRHSNDCEAIHPNPPSSVAGESANDVNEVSSHNVTERGITNENKTQQEDTIILSNSDPLTAANPSQNRHVVEVGNTIIGTTPNSIIDSQDNESHSNMENRHQHEAIVTEITSPTNDHFLDDLSSDSRTLLSSRVSEERETDDDALANPNNGPRLARLTEAEILEMAEIDYASIGNMPPHSHVASSVSSNDTRSGFRNSNETGLSFNISEGDDTQTTVQESSNASATTLSIVEVRSANSDEIILSTTSSSSSHHHFQLQPPLSKDNNTPQSRTLDEDILSEHDRIQINTANDDESNSSLVANQSVGEGEIHSLHSSPKLFQNINERIYNSSNQINIPRSCDETPKLNDLSNHNINGLQQSLFATPTDRSLQRQNRSNQPILTSNYPGDLQRETSAHQTRHVQLFITDDFESDRFQSERQNTSPVVTLDETAVLMNHQLTSSNDLYLDNSPKKNCVHYGTTNSSVYDANIKSDNNYSYVSMNSKGSKFHEKRITVNILRGDDDNANNIEDVFHNNTFNNKYSIESVFSSIRSLSTPNIEAEMKDSDKYTTNSIISCAFPERFIVLVALLIIEVPVLLIISGGSDRLCQEIGRTKYQLMMAFLPLCCAMSGNVGLQSDRVTFSAISHIHLTTHNYTNWLCKELGVSVTLGIMMSLVLGLLAYQTSGQDLSFTFAIFIAQFCSIIMGGLIGTISPILFTFLFHRDISKWGVHLITAFQDIFGSLAMVVLSYHVLLYLGPYEIDLEDTCGR